MKTPCFLVSLLIRSAYRIISFLILSARYLPDIGLSFSTYLHISRPSASYLLSRSAAVQPGFPFFNVYEETATHFCDDASGYAAVAEPVVPGLDGFPDGYVVTGIRFVGNLNDEPPQWHYLFHTFLLSMGSKFRI